MADKLQLQLRHDTASNWAQKNPVLLEGEMGVAFQNAPGDGKTWREPLFHKVGNGVQPWNDLTAFWPFKGLSSAGRGGQGRNLENPSQLGATWDFTNPFDAISALYYPYSPPTLGLGGGDFATTQVGATIGPQTLSTQLYINQYYSVLKNSGGQRLVRIDDDNANRKVLPATDEANIAFSYNKTITLNSNTAQDLRVIKFEVQRSDNEQWVGIQKSMAFRHKFGFFLLDKAQNLMSPAAYTDAQLSALFTSLTNVSRESYAELRDGRFDLATSFTVAAGQEKTLYVLGPVAYGTPQVASQFGGKAAPVSSSVRDFSYSFGTATTPYRLLKANTLDGPFDALIF